MGREDEVWYFDGAELLDPADAPSTAPPPPRPRHLVFERRLAKGKDQLVVTWSDGTKVGRLTLGAAPSTPAPASAATAEAEAEPEGTGDIEAASTPTPAPVDLFALADLQASPGTAGPSAPAAAPLDLTAPTAMPLANPATPPAPPAMSPSSLLAEAAVGSESSTLGGGFFAPRLPEPKGNPMTPPPPPGFAPRASALLGEELPEVAVPSQGASEDPEEIDTGAQEGLALVAERLESLDGRWQLLQGVELGDGHGAIDQIVVGRGGIYVVQAAHYPGAKVWVAANAFLVNGQPQEFVAQGERDAARVQAALQSAGAPVAVAAVIVVFSARLTVKAEPKGVAVVEERGLKRWLTKQRATLTPEQVQWVVDALRPGVA